MLRSEIEAEVGRLLGDPNHDRWSVDILRERAELAQQEVQALTGAVKTTESLTPTAETNEVQVSEEVLDITFATYTGADGTTFPLDGKSRESLDFYYPNWRNIGSGHPRLFAYDASNRNVILVPKPSASEITADCLKVWEVQIPDEMTADNSSPFDGNVLMRAYSMSVAYWMVAQCLMDNGNPESLTKSKFYRSGSIESPGQYELELRKINSKFNNPSAIPETIKWKPQGGLTGWRYKWPTKSDPLP
jgi:hypothetical protein